MEAYIDDILVISYHIQTLVEVFELFCKYNLKSNPEKCAFGVQSEKFHVYLVTYRRIEVDPKKIKVVVDLEPPKAVCKEQSLVGKLTALRRFISKSAEKVCSLF